MKVLLQGYIGYQNFGDDLLFEIAIDKIKKIPNVEISISITDESLTPDYLKSYYSSLKIFRFEGKLPFLFFNNFDKIYYIGGGVFFDYKKEINNSTYLKSYVSNFIRYKIPKLLGTKFGGIGLGIGPYYHKKTMKLHRQILKSFSVLGVRDHNSYEIAKSMKIKNLYQSNDLSIGYDKLPLENANADSSEIIICPRSYHHKPEFEKHIDELIKLAGFLEENGYITHWIFLQHDSEELMFKLRGKFKITIWNPFKLSISSFIELFKNVHVVFSSRMHSLFIAGLVNTPFVAIELHPKLKYASELFYDNPEIIFPLDNLLKYKQALENLETKNFNKTKLIHDKNNLKQLNIKFFEWLKK
ncbi:polysaccharide pyruvyl transferase family protein [Aureibaculum sp. A20]|uniref:Polysaccharide pyruvyl transferase family protein n=1 Tax=Aureibaculum flavum TaxID=2795986 RepID=A0ABS0WRJ6_9FLAO|nr:polysaccharide pyruvyl transferase family protein [Aureibaculum flavum]MBJ2174581.1 polysaccharide pyruvyl transferase family protein [Aureibaculum flavum]